MAEKLKESLLSPDESAKGAPRIKMGEMGYPGLALVYKQITQERERALRMPQLIRTVDDMKHDTVVAASLQFYKMMIGRVKWRVKPPENATATQKERAKFIQSCMNDMSHSWFSFITSLLSYLDYGFSIHEKCWKYRRKGNSKYDDGLIGWDKLPSRAQCTVFGWNFSEDGRDLLGFRQMIPAGAFTGSYSADLSSPVDIPRKKFLLFRSSPQDDNPEGNAPLKAAYHTWKLKQEFQKQEFIGASRDLGGLLVVRAPSDYMDANASPEKIAAYEAMQRGMRNISNGEQSAIAIPSDVNDLTKTPFFDVNLLTSTGAKSYDTNEIIARYNSDILICLFADLLQLGNGSTGSFALAGTKQDVIQYALEYRLKEIQDVLNFDLIPATFAMNEWDDTDFPTFEVADISTPDLDVYSKFIQRVVAVGAIPIDNDLMNLMRETIGLDALSDEDMPDPPPSKSRSGDGIAKGSLNGTADQVASQDNSIVNMENS